MAYPTAALRQESLDRVHEACYDALERCLADLTAIGNTVLGAAPDRLAVFRVEPGDEQPQLTGVRFVSGSRHITRGRRGAARAAFTELHGHLLDAVSHHAGQSCPAGVVVTLDQRMIAAYHPGHCAHWDGESGLAVALDAPDLLTEPPDPPYCCAAELIPYLLQRYGAAAPTRLLPSPCDGDA